MGKGDRKAHNRKKGKRTASGQLSRAKGAVAERHEEERREEFSQDARQTVYQARYRHRLEFRQPEKPKEAEAWRNKVTSSVDKQKVKQHKLDSRGSVLGRWLAEGKLTEEQVSAGEDYCHRYVRYAALNGLPRATPAGASYGDVRGGSRALRIEAAQKAKAAHAADQAKLRHCRAGVRWAIKRACVLDEAAPLSMVKEGLDALLRMA